MSTGAIFKATIPQKITHLSYLSWNLLLPHPGSGNRQPLGLTNEPT